MITIVMMHMAICILGHENTKMLLYIVLFICLYTYEVLQKNTCVTGHIAGRIFITVLACACFFLEGKGKCIFVVLQKYKTNIRIRSFQRN